MTAPAAPERRYRADNPFAPEEKRYRADNPFAPGAATPSDDRIDRNVAKMRAGGASDDEIREYLDDEWASMSNTAPRDSLARGEPGGIDPRLGRGQVADASRAIPESQYDRTPGIGTSFGRGALQGATLGFADEALGGIGALAQRGEGESSRDAYVRHRNSVRGDTDEARQAHPIATFGGELVGGGVPASGAAAVYRAVAPATRIGKAATGAGLGAVEGAVAGAGLDESGDRLGAAFGGAALGGLVGGLAPAAPRAATKAGRAAIRPLGLTTAAGRQEATEGVLAKAMRRAGVVPADVQSGRNAGASLAEALGPAADDVLRSLHGLSDETAGALATAGREVSDKALGRRMVAASKRLEKPGLAGPLLNLALGRHAGPVRALAGVPAAGLRRAARSEADHLAQTLLERGSTRGRPSPLLDALAEYHATRGAPQRGATRAQLQHREEAFGLPRVTPEPPQGAPPGQTESLDDLEGQLLRSLAAMKATGRAGSLRSRLP